MTKSEQIKAFKNWLLTQTIAKNGMARSHYISGCSTEVYPIMIFDDWCNPSLTMQWGSNREPKKFLEKCKAEFPTLISYYYFCKSDGSCPSEIVFKF